jgi:hypothetical protein
MYTIELVKDGQVVESQPEHSIIDAAELEKKARDLGSQSSRAPDSFVVRNDIKRPVVSGKL